MKELSKEEWKDEYWKEINSMAEKVIGILSLRYGVWNSLLGTEEFRDGLWDLTLSSDFTQKLTATFFTILSTDNLRKTLEKVHDMMDKKPALRVFPLAARLAMTYDIEEKINTLLGSS